MLDPSRFRCRCRLLWISKMGETSQIGMRIPSVECAGLFSEETVRALCPWSVMFSYVTKISVPVSVA